MPWEDVPIQIRQGMNEGVEDAAKPPDVPTLVQNMFWDKEGGLVKRKGLERLPSLISASTSDLESPDMVMSTGREIVVRDGAFLYAYNAVLKEWSKRGPVAPACGETVETFTGTRSYFDPDVAIWDKDSENAYVVSACGSYAAKDASDIWAIEVEVKDGKDLNEVHSSVVVTGAVDSAAPWGPKLCAFRDGVVMVYAVGQASAAALEFRIWNKNTPENGFGSATTIAASTNLYDPSIPTHARSCKVWAVCPTDDEGFVIAYIDNPNKDIILRKYNADGTYASVTATIGDSNTETGGIERVDICMRNDGNICVFYWDNPVVGSDTLKLDQRRGSDLTAVSSATVDTASAKLSGTWQRYDNLGVSHFELSDKTERLAMTWAEMENISTTWWTGATYRGHTMSSDTVGSNLDQRFDYWNMVPCNRVFRKNDRSYVLMYGGGGMRDIFGMSGTFILDCDIDDDTGATRVAFMVGQLNLAETPLVFPHSETNSLNYSLHTPNLGNCSSVEEHLGDMYFFTVEMDEYLDVAPIGKTEDNMPELNASHLRVLDFGRKPTWCSPFEGTLVVGGCMYTWYSGHESFEFGFPVPPILKVAAIAGTGYGTGVETIQWQGQWRYVDGGGFAHRGYPSGVFELSMDNTAHVRAEMAGESFPVLSKNIAQTAMEVYRTTTAIPSARIMWPFDTYVNRRDQAYTATFADAANSLLPGQPLSEPGPQAYWTALARYENVPPNGGQIAALGGSRVWTGAHWKSFKVQFSQVLDPPSASANINAPEFNESLQRGLPGRGRCTMIATLDESTYFATEDVISTVSGPGPDPSGGADTFAAPPSQLAGGVGCINPHSVVTGEVGAFFMGKAGMQLLARGGGIEYIGSGPEDLFREFPNITAAFKLSDEQHVGWSCTNEDKTDGRVIILNYEQATWFVWHVKDRSGQTVVPVSCCVHGDKLVVLSKKGTVLMQGDGYWDDNVRYIEQRYEGPAARLNGPVGKFRCRSIKAEVETLDACKFVHSYERNVGEEGLTKPIDLSIGDHGAVELKPLADRYTALKYICYDEEHPDTKTGEGFKLTGINYNIKRLPGGMNVSSGRKS